MGTVVLKAEVLFTGKGCPVCGEGKTACARTCRTCYEVLGIEITHRINAVIEAAVAAKDGHLVSQSAGEPVARDIVWGPVLAQVRIDRDARFCQPGNGIKPYWECKKTYKGGFISLFVFGAEYANVGGIVTALVELKTKVVKNNLVFYLRAQFVEGVRSDVKLAIGQYDDALNYIDDLPITMAGEHGFSVGFVPAVKTKFAPVAPTEPVVPRAPIAPVAPKLARES